MDIEYMNIEYTEQDCQMNLSNTVLIACEMQKKEIEYAAEQTNFNGCISWMEKSLHEKPKRLNAALQEEINKWQDKEAIILSYGMCGNGILGLVSPGTTLVLPKFDDCIRMLLSPGKNRPIPSAVDTLYYTEGWMDTSDCLLQEVNSYDLKYGPEKGAKFTKLVLSGYNSVSFIDTGFYDISPCAKAVESKCRYCGLKIQTVPGNIRILTELLAGHYDDEFVVKAPGEKIELKDFDNRARCVFD